MLQRLPTETLSVIFLYLSLREQWACVATCIALWRSREILRLAVEDVGALPEDANTFPLSHKIWDHFKRIKRLDIGKWATDAFLVALAPNAFRKDELLPLLEHISVARSLVSDAAVFQLARGSTRRTTLKSIDITFCQNTSYMSVVKLCEVITHPNLLVRRLPDWLVGCFVTPFGEGDEVHTYWADGTFSFSRGEQSTGFVESLYEHSDARISDTLQYTNLPQHFPRWFHRTYRPGVTLYNVPRGSDSLPSVLVAQHTEGNGSYAPHDYPQAFHVPMVPLGESRYFDKQGYLIDANAPADERWILMSHMPVRPLPKLPVGCSRHRAMPPRERIAANADFLKDGDRVYPVGAAVYR